MKIVFMGTPALAIPALELLHAEHEIVLCVTQPDKPAGRGHKLLPSPVKEYSRQHNIALAQPARARDESFVSILREAKPDAIAVVAYGQILPREILDLPRENFENGGCVNLHFSLLPRWRGAAPVQYAVWNGDIQTGVTTQWVGEKLDAGDIILQREIPIENDETSGELFEKLTPLGAQVFSETMRLMQNENAPRTPQNESDATHAPTIKKEDAQINWQQSAVQIHNHIRAFNPRPTAQCAWQNAPLKIHRARTTGSTPNASTDAGVILENKEKLLVQTGAGALELLEVQPPGKPRMPALDWARGARLSIGDTLE
jgi:methionyl-tRNA formyltransferase